VILHRAGNAREDIELKRPRGDRRDEVPPGKAQDELPPSVCPDGSPLSLWQHQSREPAPGTSPLDVFRRADAEVEPDGSQPPKDSAEEGGDA
jgi:hypothetical protein